MSDEEIRLAIRKNGGWRICACPAISSCYPGNENLVPAPAIAIIATIVCTVITALIAVLVSFTVRLLVVVPVDAAVVSAIGMLEVAIVRGTEAVTGDPVVASIV